MIGPRASRTAVLEARGRVPGSPGVLFLHGGGKASKERFAPLMTELFELGHSSWAFDFFGHGESDGDLREQSLARREEQARSIIENVIDGPLVLIGFSMSGQTVCDLVARPPENGTCGVVLGAPAAYAAEAHRVPFGGGFTEIIRTPGSWKTSSSFGHIETFTGLVGLVVPGLDNVIPPAVTTRYREAVTVAGGLCVDLIDAPHQLGTWLNKCDGDRDVVLALLLTQLARVAT